MIMEFWCFCLNKSYNCTFQHIVVFALKLTQFLRVCKDGDREQHNMDQPWKTKNLITNQRRSIISFLVGTQQEYLALLSLHTDWIGRV